MSDTGTAHWVSSFITTFGISCCFLCTMCSPFYILTWVTRMMPHISQKLLFLSEHPSSLLVVDYSVLLIFSFMYRLASIIVWPRFLYLAAYFVFLYWYTIFFRVLVSHHFLICSNSHICRIMWMQKNLFTIFCWILIEVKGCQEVKWLFCYNHKLFYLVARGLIEIWWDL